MNKQELIERLEARHVCDLAVSDSFKNGFNTMKGIAVDLASELDEPVKPEVPQWFDQWYTAIKNDSSLPVQTAPKEAALHLINQCGYGHFLEYPDGENVQEQIKVTRWINDNKLLANRAILDGYTVKQEPKYIVKLPMVNWNDEASELQDDFAFLILDITSDETRISGSDKDFKTWIARLTEREIKSIDERYWAFAVPVDGEVEEV